MLSSGDRLPGIPHIPSIVPPPKTPKTSVITAKVGAAARCRPAAVSNAVLASVLSGSHGLSSGLAPLPRLVR